MFATSLPGSPAEPASEGAGQAPPTAERVTEALAGVQDPEIHRPITELGMVKNVEVAADGTVKVAVWLTVSGCPLRDKITADVQAAVGRLPGVSQVRVELDVMSEEQRKELTGRLRGGKPEREIPFASPSSLTKVYAVASGKGGVGKSTVTVNLAVAFAAAGQKVGLLDADIYGHSMPRMLGVTGRPTQVEQMIMPPVAHGVKAISSGMLKKGNEPLPLRGPILHRLLQQFLADVYWGDLDVLLLDLPPGTGDVAISAAHLVPGAELIVVTTPPGGGANAQQARGRRRAAARRGADRCRSARGGRPGQAAGAHRSAVTSRGRTRPDRSADRRAIARPGRASARPDASLNLPGQPQVASVSYGGISPASSTAAGDDGAAGPPSVPAGQR